MVNSKVLIKGDKKQIVPNIDVQAWLDDGWEELEGGAAEKAKVPEGLSNENKRANAREDAKAKAKAKAEAEDKAKARRDAKAK